MGPHPSESECPMRRPIIAAVDGSPTATEAARVAASLALRLDRRLILAHVVEDRPVFPHGDHWLREVQRRRTIGGGARLLSAVGKAIGEETARKRVVLSGSVHDDLANRLDSICREEGADLLVVGARARGALARALLASLSASIASTAACPAIAVPKGTGDPFARGRLTPFGPIICGIDGSVESERARVVAEDLGASLGLEVLPTFADQVGRWDDAPGGLQVEVGAPVAGLAEAAVRREAVLIAVGTRGRRAPLGSVARELIGYAGVPILVVPPTARLPHFAPTQAPALQLAA